MKRFYISILVLLPLLAKAQSDSTPGSYMISANKQFKQSMITGVIGSGLLAGSAYAFTRVENPKELGMQHVGSVMGSVLIISSIVSQIKAWHYVGKAGEKLNEKGIGFNPTQNGVGLTYRF